MHTHACIHTRIWSQTEGGPLSLFHACSLSLWGVHDRTSLLREAVEYCLTDPKAQFLLYDRWSQQQEADAAKKVTS